MKKLRSASARRMSRSVRSAYPNCQAAVPKAYSRRKVAASNTARASTGARSSSLARTPASSPCRRRAICVCSCRHASRRNAPSRSVQRRSSSPCLRRRHHHRQTSCRPMLRHHRRFRRHHRRHSLIRSTICVRPRRWRSSWLRKTILAPILLRGLSTPTCRVFHAPSHGILDSLKCTASCCKRTRHDHSLLRSMSASLVARLPSARHWCVAHRNARERHATSRVLQAQLSAVPRLVL